jgi:hypothetical protein
VQLGSVDSSRHSRNLDVDTQQSQALECDCVLRQSKDDTSKHISDGVNHQVLELCLRLVVGEAAAFTQSPFTSAGHYCIGSIDAAAHTNPAHDS